MRGRSRALGLLVAVVVVVAAAGSAYAQSSPGLPPPDATVADALSTALSVLTPETGLRMIEATDGVEARIVRRLSGIEKTYVSKNFPP